MLDSTAVLVSSHDKWYVNNQTTSAGLLRVVLGFLTGTHPVIGSGSEN